MMNTSELVPTADTLAGRVVLVTGANGGLGEAVVHACAAAGAQVVLMGRRLPKLTRLYDALVAAGVVAPGNPLICTEHDLESGRACFELGLNTSKIGVF